MARTTSTVSFSIDCETISCVSLLVWYSLKGTGNLPADGMLVGYRVSETEGISKPGALGPTLSGDVPGRTKASTLSVPGFNSVRRSTWYSPSSRAPNKDLGTEKPQSSMCGR